MKLRITSFFAMTLIFMSCAGPRIRPEQLSHMTHEQSKKTYEVTKGKYLLREGDAISVKFFYQNDLNEDLVIRPDGHISLQLIQDVLAAGKTPAELAGEITESFKGILKSPEATVIVTDISPPQIYVGGEVLSAGILRPTAKITALQAIFQAGGLKDTASIKQAILIRRNNDGSPKVYEIDLEKPANDLVLQDLDVVYVPRSYISSINLFVDQYINRLVPNSVSFAYVYELNPQSDLRR